MTISAKMICDSISEQGIRLSTMQLRYPKFIHQDFMTHRDFSRNASSARAIPFDRFVKDIREDTAMPAYWGSEQKGMQAGKEIDNPAYCKACWIRARDEAIEWATEMHDRGLHKQTCNRILEPFVHINVVISSTRWANWFSLRDHEAAQPEIKMLARQMKLQLEESKPQAFVPGQWHLPYVTESDEFTIFDGYVGNGFGPADIERALDICRKLSVARCASVSYQTVDGQPMTIERALVLYDKLVGSSPVHASPTEHQATPDEVDMSTDGWQHPEEHGNFHGWRQFRKMIPGEYVR